MDSLRLSNPSLYKKSLLNILARYLTSSRAVLLLAFAVAATFASTPANATTKPELVPEQAGIDQLLDNQLNLDLRFTSDKGETKPLRDFLIGGRPTIIIPVYYGCPRLCGYTLNGMVKLIDELDFALGKDYKVLAITFNPEETKEMALERAKEQRAKLKQPERAENGWEFLVADAETLRTIMSQLGFKFQPDSGEFSHAAGLMVVTPLGKISRYFFGIEFPSQEMRYTLIEASQGKIGGIIDHVFLYCFRFDPTKGKYSLVVWNITRVICAFFAVGLALMLILLRMKENAV